MACERDSRWDLEKLSCIRVWTMDKGRLPAVFNTPPPPYAHNIIIYTSLTALYGSFSPVRVKTRLGGCLPHDGRSVIGKSDIMRFCGEVDITKGSSLGSGFQDDGL